MFSFDYSVLLRGGIAAFEAHDGDLMSLAGDGSRFGNPSLSPCGTGGCSAPSVTTRIAKHRAACNKTTPSIPAKAQHLLALYSGHPPCLLRFTRCITIYSAFATQPGAIFLGSRVGHGILLRTANQKLTGTDV
jgi:hypothetical protein